MSAIGFRRGVAHAAIWALLLVGSGSPAATLNVVEAGSARHLVSGGNAAATLPSQDGFVELADFRGFFPVTARLGDAFTAKIRMAVGKAKNAGASVVLDGDSHFGFYGGQRRMFLSGPLFKGVVLYRPTPDPVLAGRPFDLEIARTTGSSGATLTFRIDGEMILTLEGSAPAVSEIGFRPSHSEIRIASMTIEGDVRPVARSKDKGNTCFDPVPKPWGLTSDRHQGVQLPDGKIDALAAQDDEPRDLKKPEVDLAAKGAKRAWESAPAASKALWLEHREALTHVDLSADEQRQVIVARGTTEANAYHAHPATAMLADGRTIFCVWNIGHGGHAGPIARSDDAGLTWHRIDGVMPPNYVNFKGGIIFRITDAHGKDRLWVFSGKTAVGKDEVINDFPGRLQGYVPRMVSEDDGKTWREEPPLGPGRLAKDEPFRCVFAFSTILPLKDGSHLGMFHRAAAAGGAATLQVMQSVTRDGGFTWSEPVVACDGTKLAGKDPCEPYVFRSPDGGELCCLMRENKRSGTSLVMFSRDEGQTWSEAVDAPWGLTGDRHHGIRLPDGRLVIVFRHAAPNAKDRGLIAWVGTYDDIKQGKPGQYRVSLIKTFKDGLYPGLHLLPDGTIVATTYASLGPQENPSIVSIRFTIAEVDALAAKAEKQ